jgi:MFS family permease
MPLLSAAGGSIRRRLEPAVGGPARTRVVVLFACVLALESADLATVGSVGPQLESQLHISNTELGLLAAISTFVGAVMTVPFGVLADRVRRVDLLAGAVASWTLAMTVSATAQSYGWLLLSRIGLGAVTAVAAPVIASLTGDLFPTAERGKIYGYVLSGELLGTGFGFVISGGVSSALSWRWGFAILALPALLLAGVIRRVLVEPARGGQSRLDPGASRILSAEEAAHRPEDSSAAAAERESDAEVEMAIRAIVSDGVRAEPDDVLHQDPGRMSLWRVIRYVLSIRTNRWLIVASAIGYFFFAGMRTFGVVFVRGHYSLSEGSAVAMLFVAGLGSLAGVLVAGRLADRLVLRGEVTARVLVGAISYSVVAVFLAPAILVNAVAIALPLLIVAGAGLGAPNPPLDAARLDIMPASLWGRAEGVRTMVRNTAQAGAPLLFGVIADTLGGGGGALSAGASQQVSAATSRGLEYTFLIMLVPLALNGVLLLVTARRSYPTDVATAIATERSVARATAPARAPLSPSSPGSVLSEDASG